MKGGSYDKQMDKRKREVTLRYGGITLGELIQHNKKPEGTIDSNKLLMCQSCNRFSKIDYMFIKQYEGVVLCLCKKCAKQLVNEINERG